MFVVRLIKLERVDRECLWENELCLLAVGQYKYNRWKMLYI